MDGILAAPHADGRMCALKGDAQDGTICVRMIRARHSTDELISLVQEKDVDEREYVNKYAKGQRWTR